MPTRMHVEAFDVPTEPDLFAPVSVVYYQPVMCSILVLLGDVSESSPSLSAIFSNSVTDSSFRIPPIFGRVHTGFSTFSSISSELDDLRRRCTTL